MAFPTQKRSAYQQSMCRFVTAVSKKNAVSSNKFAYTSIVLRSLHTLSPKYRMIWPFDMVRSKEKKTHWQYSENPAAAHRLLRALQSSLLGTTRSPQGIQSLPAHGRTVSELVGYDVRQCMASLIVNMVLLNFAETSGKQVRDPADPRLPPITTNIV